MTSKGVPLGNWQKSEREGVLEAGLSLATKKKDSPQGVTPNIREEILFSHAKSASDAC